jgi:hypothetical protein
MLGRHRPKFYAIAGVALAVAAPPRAGSAGVTVALPPGWHSTRPVQGHVTNPLTRLAVASGSIRSRLTGACDAQVADYVIPRDAVAIVVVEWTKPIGGMKIGIGPRRPRQFTATTLAIHRAPIIECWPGAGGSVEWAERGHTFAAYVLLGIQAPPRRAAQARAVLDTLRIAPR